MKKASAIFVALAVILCLFASLIMAQEDNDKPEKTKKKSTDKPAIERVKKRDRMPPDQIYDEILKELKLQRREIQALKEEIADLRKMLEEQYDLRRTQQRDRWYTREGVRNSERDADKDSPERREIEKLNPHIKKQIKMDEEKIRLHPDDIDVRMRLGHMYQEMGKIEATIMQYKAALEIDPDFDPPYNALKELGYKFPDADKEVEEKLEDSVGEVISSTAEEIKVKVLEGDIVIFRIPSWQRDDGSWFLDEDLSEMAKSLDPGVRVKILWRKHEGHRVIRRMERIKEDER